MSEKLKTFMLRDIQEAETFYNRSNDELSESTRSTISMIHAPSRDPYTENVHIQEAHHLESLRRYDANSPLSVVTNENIG